MHHYAYARWRAKVSPLPQDFRLAPQSNICALMRTRQVDALVAWRERERPYSRKSRSMFCALSKFLAASNPIGSISLVEARSAPLKSPPLTMAPARVAPPKAAPRSDALVRSVFLRDANSRSTRDRSASRKIARSRLLDFSTARMSPID